MQALRKPRLTGLTDEEIAAVDFAIAQTDDAGVGESANEQTWRTAKIGEPLPLFAQLATRMRKPTEQELERARKIARDLTLG